MSIVYKAVEDLLPLDMVDLEGDPYADPDEEVGFQYELTIVESVERETDDCVLVVTMTDGVFGFPVGHQVPVHDEA